MHHIPLDRARHLAIIEEVIPVRNIGVSLKVPGKVSDVRLVLDGGALDLQEKGDRIELTVPEVGGHQMVEVAIAGLS